MSAIYLHDIGCALGGNPGTVEAAAAAGLLESRPESLRHAGFEVHHRAADDESACDLAFRAVADMPRHPVNASVVIYGTALPVNGNVGDVARFEQTRDVRCFMDFPVSRLLREAGLESAVPIGLGQQACTALLGSVRLGRALLTAEAGISTVLCVTADRFPPGARYEQAFSLISDGAAACALSREPRGYRVLACHHRANGALASASAEETLGQFFPHTHALVRETAAAAGLAISDLDWIVPQNMNRSAWQILARALGFPEDRVWLDPLPEIAHVISADNLVNLRSLEEHGALKPGDRLALPMSGYGMNWQCLILEKV